MQKFLLFILLLVGIYYWRRSSLRDDRNDRSRSSSPRSAEPPRIETVLACAHCDLLVPRSEGVSAGGEFFCCAEHARLGRKTPHA